MLVGLLRVLDFIYYIFYYYDCYCIYKEKFIEKIK